MYVMNGIVYGGNSDTGIKIRAVRALDNMILILTFSNGETRLFDASELEGPVYEPLKNPEIFKKPEIDHGVVTWQDGRIDCAPEYMYQKSYEYFYEKDRAM